MADHRIRQIDTTQGTATVRAMRHGEWRDFSALVRKVQAQLAANEPADDAAVEDFLLRFVTLPEGGDVGQLERWEVLDLIEAVKGVTVEGSAKN